MAHSMGARAILRFLENKREWNKKIKGILLIDILPSSYKDN
jgi:predicted alpha/beta hydrolase family esterase